MKEKNGFSDTMRRLRERASAVDAVMQMHDLFPQSLALRRLRAAMTTSVSHVGPEGERFDPTAD